MKQQANNTLRQKLPMKKRVSASVYAELSIKQREVLRDWWEPQVWDLVLVDRERFGRKFWETAAITRIEPGSERPLFTTASDKPKAKSECLPWLDMGMCVDFLMGMCVDFLLDKPFKVDWDHDDKEIQLIDLLWNEVKETLEREAR